MDARLDVSDALAPSDSGQHSVQSPGYEDRPEARPHVCARLSGCPSSSAKLVILAADTDVLLGKPFKAPARENAGDFVRNHEGGRWNISRRDSAHIGETGLLA